MKAFIFFLVTALISTGCRKENLCDCLKSTGPVVKEIRSLAPFERIDVFKNVFVSLYQDSVEFVEVEAGSHVIDLVETSVENGKLLITNRNKCNWVRSYEKEIHVTVHLKKIYGLDHYGAKEISCINQIQASWIDIREHNSADIRMNITGDSIFVRQMIGGGDIYLQGSSGFLYTFVGSFGYVHAKDFICDSAQVDHRGSGDIHVHPKTWMLANVEGNGNVYYSGNPVIEAYIKGSGRIYRE